MHTELPWDKEQLCSSGWESHLIPCCVDELENEWQQLRYQALVLLLVICALPSLLNAEI